MSAGDDFDRARELLAAQEFAKAESVFRAILDRDGAHAGALKGLAALLAVTGRADEAAVLLRTRLRQEPGDDAALRALGMALCRKAGMQTDPHAKAECFAAAAETLGKAVERAGWDAETAAGLAAAQAGRGLRGEALHTLSEALAHVLEPPAARLRLYSEALLFQAMWDMPAEAARTVGLMRHEATNDTDALERELLRLAREARRMAGAGPPWSARALALAGLLEELAP